MPDQLNRISPLIRLAALIAVVILSAQVSLIPVAAAPARNDDELSVTSAQDEGELATEPAAEEGEPIAEESEPIAEEGESADESANAEDVPADESEELADEPAPAEEEAVAESAPTDEVQAEEEVASEPALEITTMAAALAPIDDPVADGFLIRLLNAINARRSRNGTQHLSYVPAHANAALDGFLARTAPANAWPGPCGHHLVGGSFSWDFVNAAGYGGAPRGEVLACPGPEPYWTPDRTAEQWWESPIHFDVLYADPYANALACSALGRGSVGDGGSSKKKNNRGSGAAEAASAVICVTFSR
jgi:uncharacterized protein YkwD